MPRRPTCRGPAGSGTRSAAAGTVALPSVDYSPRDPAADVLYRVVRDHRQAFLAEAPPASDVSMDGTTLVLTEWGIAGRSDLTYFRKTDGSPARYAESHIQLANDRISQEDAGRQRRAAIEILARLHGQPGIVLADEVGMGKTFVALAVAVSMAGCWIGRTTDG